MYLSFVIIITFTCNHIKKIKLFINLNSIFLKLLIITSCIISYIQHDIINNILTEKVLFKVTFERNPKILLKLSKMKLSYLLHNRNLWYFSNSLTFSVLWQRTLSCMKRMTSSISTLMYILSSDTYNNFMFLFLIWILWRIFMFSQLSLLKIISQARILLII